MRSREGTSRAEGGRARWRGLRGHGSHSGLSPSDVGTTGGSEQKCRGPRCCPGQRPVRSSRMRGAGLPAREGGHGGCSQSCFGISFEINWFRQFCGEVDTEAKGQGQAGNRAPKSLSASHHTTVLITPLQGTSLVPGHGVPARARGRFTRHLRGRGPASRAPAAGSAVQAPAWGQSGSVLACRPPGPTGPEPGVGLGRVDSRDAHRPFPAPARGPPRPPVSQGRCSPPLHSDSACGWVTASRFPKLSEPPFPPQ